MSDNADPARATAEAAAWLSHGRLVAVLASRVRDVASAEDALAEAFATAPASGRSAAARRTARPGC